MNIHLQDINSENLYGWPSRDPYSKKEEKSLVQQGHTIRRHLMDLANNKSAQVPKNH
jgi:hypothetical protein